MSISERIHETLPSQEISTWAIVGGLAGLMAAVPGLPPVVSAVLLLGFIALGPGAAIMYWVPDQPMIALRALVPLVGLASVILVVSGLLFANIYQPKLSLLVMAAITIGAGVRNRMASRRIDRTAT